MLEFAQFLVITMGEIFVGIVRVIHELWKADERPEARRLTLGCGLVLLILAGVLWWCLR
jgi:hypothetical protein